MLVVAKIGTSSVTTSKGTVDEAAVQKLCGEVAQLRRAGHDIVIVSSGAVTAGVAALALASGRPNDATTLQALSAIGQHRLMRVYDDALGLEGLVAAQVLLTPPDFFDRRQYVHARSTLERLIELGVIAVVNENDAVADDEIRFGDNDFLAALVANLCNAALLVLLTDQAGVFDADPRKSASATLVEEIRVGDAQLEAAAGGPGSQGGSGGMATKLAAARIASWSAVRVVIASAKRPNVLADAVAQKSGIGSNIAPQDRRLSARKLWIAFALPPKGRVVVDDGARAALEVKDASLLCAGVVDSRGAYDVDDAIEIVGRDGTVFAKGLVRLPARRSEEWMGRRMSELPSELASELIHKDDLVIFGSEFSTG